jgi:hypothetical protein
MGKDAHLDEFIDPELEYIEGSEIAAAVDVSSYGEDQIFRPIFINQDKEILALTQSDAKRLLGFLQKAVKFVDDFQSRNIQ